MQVNNIDKTAQNWKKNQLCGCKKKHVSSLLYRSHDYTIINYTFILFVKLCFCSIHLPPAISVSSVLSLSASKS